ncbi:hypothetical protein BDW22DRAFT_798403 [Trametopsis cervina]|nr:hypothetical protein BDW22DRAFT_798403 [Trametopsis cervina]
MLPDTKHYALLQQSSGLRITLPAVVRKAVSKPLHICKKAWCHNMLAPRSRWKTCVFCRRTSRMYERAKRGGYYKWLKNDEDDDILDQTGEVVVLTGGRRKCTIRTCTEILPPAEEYRWKMCEGCRTRTRLRARERKHDAPAKPGSTSTTSDEDADLPLSKQLELKRQIQRLKGLTLTFRGRTIAKVDTRPPESPSLPTHVATPVEAAKGWAQSMLVHDNVVRMTVYQTFEGLIEDFYTRLASFVTAQSLYILSKRMRQPGSDVGSPAVFTFDGEYSVVADPAGGDVSARIHAVQVTISQHLGLEFRHIGTRVDPSGMIDGAFSCTHEVLIPLPEEPTAPTEVPLEATEGKSIPQPQALLRRMAGELNISLSWDRSHLYFPGMRTAVRFCLVG